jgi:4-hydroxybenzoate polyprenyltransferase/phosphoserine phosphatase
MSIAPPSDRPASAARATVICVDLDGTLAVGDLLWESFIALLKKRPVAALTSVFGLLKGRAEFKQRIAALAPVDPAAVAYRPEVLDYLREQRSAGAFVVLATASDKAHAQAIADHLGLFDEVVASDGQTNLKGEHKAAHLAARFGRGAFEYIGNEAADLAVWRAASGATVVNATPALTRRIAADRLPTRILSTRRPWLRSVAGALRPHQWSKNVLIFVPAIAAHTILQANVLVAGFIAFVAFSACASAIYVLNDILDVQADRLHPRKRRRPFAAGEFSIPSGGIAVIGLLTVSFLTCVLSGLWTLTAVLLVYLVTTTAYSVYLKRKPVFDVFALTALYLLRIVAGGVATSTPLSSWLLAFALFFFLSLAFVKRYSELLTIRGWMPGRGYNSDDMLWGQSVGTAAGYMAVVVLALYVNAPDVAMLYSRPQVVWLLCPLLLMWLTRLWFRAGRRQVHDDPVVEALRDWFSYATGAAAVIVILLAI